MYSEKYVIIQTWNRFKKHFCVGMTLYVVDEFISFLRDPRDKKLFYLMMRFSLFFTLYGLLYLIFYLYYKKYLGNKMSESWPIVFGLFMADAMIVMGLCQIIPVVIYSIIRYFAPDVSVNNIYVGIVNLVTFVVVLFYCIYLKFSFQISNTLLYTWFFIIYAVSVLYGFSPDSLKHVILKFLYNGDPEYSRQFLNIYKPAIKEAVLAFTILDSANLIPKLQGYLLRKE